MEEIVSIREPGELARFSATDVPLVGSEDLTNHAPDVHLILLRAGRVAAHCSLWWRGTPELQGRRTGCIGHYAAFDGRSGAALLEHACRTLTRQDAAVAVGPLDGSTWRRYRYIVDRGTEPIFFLEPDNPDDWPGHFADAGFRELASYSSSLNTELSYTDPRLPKIEARMERQTVTIRGCDLSRFEQELDGIFELSLASFSQNFLYTPISSVEFKAMYRKVQALVRPELTLLAEHAGRTVGFAFVVPDILQQKRGVPVDTVIIKSLAVLPGRAYAGLGGLLMAKATENARALGFRRAIHALMHESNHSRNLNPQHTRPIRRYVLFSRELS